MLTLEQLKGMVKKGEIETVLAGFTDHYGRLMGKRFDAEMFVDEVAEGGGHACDYLLTVDMEMEPVPGYKFANWELGYGDVHMVADMDTLRIATEPSSALVPGYRLGDAAIASRFRAELAAEPLLQVADAAGHERITLTTFSELEAAAHLYRATGFERVSASPLAQWGRTITMEVYERRRPAMG